MKSYVHSLVPDLQNIFLDYKKNKVLGVMELCDGTLKDLLFDDDISFNEKFKIIINVLYQVSFYLIILQNRFKFVHNDLKINNILFKKGVKFKRKIYNFVLTDFGFSRLEIFNELTFSKLLVIASSKQTKNYKNSLKFNQNKDLYFLFHNILYFSQNNKKLMEKLINFGNEIFGNLSLNYLDESNGWNNLYNECAGNNYEFNPNCFISKLKRNKNYCDYVYHYFNLPYQ